MRCKLVYVIGAISALAVGLSGCFGQPRLAPVVNGWYQSNAKNTYRVRHGDTIYSIAWAFGLDYRALVAINHLHPPYAIAQGQQLRMTTTPNGQRGRYPQPQEPRPLVSNYTGPSQVSIWRWPTRGRLVERFTPGMAGSQGIAIAGRFGQPIVAAAKGEVVYSGDGVRGYGNLVIIKHNRHYLSAYAFNEHNLVKVGDEVPAGSVIARMGRNDAGNTLLYFEIRRDGHPVDPLQFLR